MIDTSTASFPPEEWISRLAAMEIDTGEPRPGRLVWDVRTGSTNWNETWAVLFGLPHAGRSGPAGVWENTIHSDDLPGVMEELNEHLAGNTEIFVAEYRLNPGCMIPYSIRTSGLVMARNPSGRPISVILVSRKITALEFTRARRYESPLWAAKAPDMPDGSNPRKRSGRQR